MELGTYKHYRLPKTIEIVYTGRLIKNTDIVQSSHWKAYCLFSLSHTNVLHTGEIYITNNNSSRVIIDPLDAIRYIPSFWQQEQLAVYKEENNNCLYVDTISNLTHAITQNISKYTKNDNS